MWYLNLNSLKLNTIKNSVSQVLEPRFSAQLPHVARGYCPGWHDTEPSIPLARTARESTQPLDQRLGSKALSPVRGAERVKKMPSQGDCHYPGCAAAKPRAGAPIGKADTNYSLTE